MKRINMTLDECQRRGAKIGNPLTLPTTGKPATAKTDLEDDLADQLSKAGIPFAREAEYLIPGRKFRFDFCIAHGQRWILVEVQGAIHSSVYAPGGGRRNRPSGHNTASGITRDAVKSNEAQLAGHVLLKVTRDHIRSGRAIDWIKRAMELTQ